VTNAELAKEISARAVIAAVIFGLVYLLGAFNAASFDITKWDIGLRAFVSFMGGVVALLISAYPFERFTS
jgi:hypothetical protein